MDAKPWSNDEIILRIRMIEDNHSRMSVTGDGIMLSQMLREIATWKELLTRRQTGVTL